MRDITSDQMGQQVTEFVTQKITKRRKFERRWYNNNFFDDGFHFKTINRKTGRAIDTLTGSKNYVERAIPRASLQIRGVANLLLAAELYPVVNPERVTLESFRDPSGQVNIQAYQQALEKSKQVARRRGMWIMNEWEKQSMIIKCIEALISGSKESVSYIQVYSDTDDQKIKTKVRSSFEVVLDGELKSVNEQSQIAIVEPMSLVTIKSNPLFDDAKVAKLNPDNKYATSDVADAYYRSKYGMKSGEGDQATLLVAENYMKENLGDENWARIVKIAADTGAMEGKSKGDIIMRHTYSAGGVVLKDEYIDYDEYPLVDFRYEPGPLYQTPFIERFIPQNKSLDIIMTRLEKWVNTMVVGVYQKRKGENFQVSNMAGGQVLEYDTTPLTQLNTSTVGNTPFALVGLLDKYIEEQGASTAALGQIDGGVKSGKAIESLKASEYANLKIPTLMLKDSMKRVAELMIERAEKDFIKPVPVDHMEDAEPQYFDVVGKRGAEMAQKVGKALPEDTVVLHRDIKLKIEMEPGLGLTSQGKRESMEQIINLMIQLSTGGFIDKEPLKIVIKKFLDTYGFGSTQEFMEAFDQSNNGQQLTEDQIAQMKIAVVEVLKDLQLVGPQADQKMVDSTKVGVVEALKDTGMLNKDKPQDTQKVSESVSFKDLPVAGKIQMAQKAGIRLTPEDFAQQAAQETAKAIANKPTIKPLTSQ